MNWPPSPYQPYWDSDQLVVLKPRDMDTLTLIEWLDRQMETPEETEARHQELRDLHDEWHARTPGIFACCIGRRSVPWRDTTIRSWGTSEIVADVVHDTIQVGEFQLDDSADTIWSNDIRGEAVQDCKIDPVPRSE